MRKSRKLWWAIIPVVAVTVAGCAPAGPAAGPTDLNADEQVLGGADAVASMEEFYNAAVDSGKTSVTVYGAGEVDKVPVYEEFMKRFPGITVNGVFLVGPDFHSKLESEVATGTHIADLVQSGDTALASHLGGDYFEPFTPVTSEGLSAEYQDETGLVLASSATVFGFMYNTDKLDEGDAPKGWEDLLDPSYKGLIASDDVTHTGGGFSTLNHILWDGRFGDDYINDLAKQDFHFEPQAALAGTTVATGQYSIEPFYPLSYFMRDKANGAPVEWVFPTDGGVHISPHYLALMQGAQNPDAAKLLMTWLFSPEGQQAQAAVGYYPLMPGEAGPSGYPTAEELDLFKSFPIETVNDIATENAEKVKAAFQ